MKVRTQIQLDREDHEALRRFAKRRGTSLSAAVRWLIRERLRATPAATDDRVAAFLSAAGVLAGRRGEGAVSAGHDQVLYAPRRR